METIFHPLTDLFEQLGIPSSRQSISAFIAHHAPLNPSVMLAEADFWTPEQKNFLKEELLKDADWAATIDLLNIQLRETY